MKFPTQHRHVIRQNMLECFKAHRDGATTWKTKTTENVVFDTINHPTIAAAKHWMSGQ